MNDTHPKTQAKLLELMRQTSSQKRLELMSLFSQELMTQSRRTLAQRMPQHEANLEWVRINYGLDIANRLRKYFDGIAENHKTSH
jgi:hypothetical protein